MTELDVSLDKFSMLINDLKDPNENIYLQDIPILSRRIFSLIVRHKNKIRNRHDYAHITGSVQFIEGLEYHYNNFVSHLNVLASKAHLEDDSMLDHEVVAYLNRLGQIYYFVRSLDLLEICPKIVELYLFRKKNTGHRSIDYPLKDDDPNEQIWQSGCLRRKSFDCKFDDTFTHENFQEYKTEFLTPKRYANTKVLISYQILNKGDHADLTLQLDHPIIISEIEHLFEKIFDSR